MDKKLVGRIALVTLVVALGFFGIYRYVSSVANGQVKPAIKPAAVHGPERTLKIANQYASFNYPASFVRTTSDPPIAPVVLNYSFIKQQIGSWQAAIQYTKLATGSLNDDGSYNYRRISSSRYTSVSTTVNGQPVTIFTDTTSNTFSKVAYLQHGDIDASIALLGGTTDSINQLQTDFTAMIASWHWQ